MVKWTVEFTNITSSSSSDRVDSRGPLRQPGVGTTTSLRPFTNACERPPASVDPPAEVSTSPNHTTKWTVYKSGTSEVLSAVEAGSVGVARLCS